MINQGKLLKKAYRTLHSTVNLSLWHLFIVILGIKISNVTIA